MLRVHEAVAIMRRAYPDQVLNEGEGLRHDCFYYGLLPSLRDALSFAMADLPEREQVNTSFDTLYHLAKKMEVRHQPHSASKGGTSTHEPYKGYKSIPPWECVQQWSTPNSSRLIQNCWRMCPRNQTIWKV